MDPIFSFGLNLEFAQTLKWIPFAVLGVSLLGSGHCVAMCGGLILTVARSPAAVVRYHIGRLGGYVALGALAGFLGKATLQSQAFQVIPWLSSTLLALGFIVLGIQLWQGKSLHFFSLPDWILQKLSHVGSGTVGALSAFLPCGWLHVFILGAVATQSPLRGAIYLLFFWLGTLPALSLGPWVVRQALKPISQRVPRLSAICFIALGVSCLAMKMVPSSKNSCCHHSQDLHEGEGQVKLKTQ